MSVVNSFIKYFKSSIFRSVLTFFSAILLAGYLGAEARGLLGIITALSVFSAIFCSFGLPQIMSVKYQALKDNLNRIILTFLVAIFCICLLVFIYFFDDPALIIISIILSVSALCIMLSREFLRGANNFTIISKSIFTEGYVVVICAVITIIMQFNLINYLVLFTALNLALSMYLVFKAVIIFRKNTIYEEKIKNKTQLRYTATNFLIPMAQQSPILIAGILSFDAVLIGVFALASGLIKNMESIPNSITQVLLPHAKESKETRYISILIITIMFNIIFSILVFTFVKTLITPLLPEEFSSLSQFFAILSIGYVFASNSKVLNIAFNLANREDYETKGALLRVILQSSFILLTYESLGIYSALIGIALSQILRFCYTVFCFASLFKINFSSEFKEAKKIIVTAYAKLFK